MVLEFTDPKSKESAKRKMSVKIGPKKFTEKMHHNGVAVKVFPVKPLYQRKHNQHLYDEAEAIGATVDWRTRRILGGDGNAIGKQNKQTWAIDWF